MNVLNIQAIYRVTVAQIWCIISNPRIVDPQDDAMAGLPILELLEYPK